MKIYAAAVYHSGLQLHGPLFARMDDREKQARMDLPYILESYHYVGRGARVDQMRRDGVRIFLDSGAFSAFILGVKIDLRQYIKYCHENKAIIEQCSVLDSVGDPAQTFQNQEVMEREGLKPIPCFHYGEDESWLANYVEKYDHVSLGGMVPVSTPQLALWLDRIWRLFLCDKAGRAKVKVHGFGLTRFQLIWRYPWHSVDSTVWRQAGSNGGLILPPDGTKIPVSGDSPARQTEGRHFNTLTEPEQWVVYNTVTTHGFSFQRLQEIYLARWMFNAFAMEEINKHYVKSQQFNNPQLSIF